MMSSNWEDVAQRSHQSRREARESQLREESRQLELEEIEAQEEAERIAEAAEAEADRIAAEEDRRRYARTNQVMQLSRRLLAENLDEESDDAEEEEEPEEEEPEELRDRNGRRLTLAQRSEESEEEEASYYQEGTMEDHVIPDPKKSQLRKVYSKANGSQQLLIVYSMGLLSKDGNNRKLGDIVDDPFYTNMPNKSAFHPTVPIMKAEMKGRAKVQGLGNLRKNSVLRPACIQWLMSNPVSDPQDVVWIQQEEAKTYGALKDLSEEKLRDEQAKLDRSNWNTV